MLPKKDFQIYSQLPAGVQTLWIYFVCCYKTIKEIGKYYILLYVAVMNLTHVYKWIYFSFE